MKNESDIPKSLEITEIRKVRTYHISFMIIVLLMLGMIIGLFIYYIIPMHNTILTTCFIGGIVASVYCLLGEIFKPEKHTHFYFKVREDFDDWKILYLISKCIDYDPQEGIIVAQLKESFEWIVDKMVKDVMKETRK